MLLFCNRSIFLLTNDRLSYTQIGSFWNCYRFKTNMYIKLPVAETAAAAAAGAVGTVVPAAVREAQADTDDAAAVPDGAAGILWATTAAVDNASDGRATAEASVLWDSPVRKRRNKNFH